jgi:hypothetical protein
MGGMIEAILGLKSMDLIEVRIFVVVEMLWFYKNMACFDFY